MKQKEKRKQKSIRQRIKNKAEGITLGVGIAFFVYCMMVKRSFNYGKKKAEEYKAKNKK